MAITPRDVGAWAASNATTQTVTLPTHQTGDMLIVRTIRKPFTNPDDTVINTSGWNPVGTGVANGATANGNGVGSMGFKAFYKIAASSSETNPVVTWGTTSAPGAAVAVSYEKGANDTWETPTGTGGGDATARTSQTSTMSSHITVRAGDLVDFFRGQCDDSGALTVPQITQTGVTFDTVTEYPATAFTSGTSNDIAADGGYRTATAGTSSAAAVITGTSAASEQHGAWMTRLRVTTLVSSSFTVDAVIKRNIATSFTADASIAVRTTSSFTANAVIKRTMFGLGATPPTFVQEVGSGAAASSTTLNISVGVTTTVGNHLLVGSFVAVASIVDSRGNKWSLIRNQSSIGGIGVWGARIETALVPGDTITLTLTASASGPARAAEYSGVGGAGDSVHGAGTAASSGSQSWFGLVASAIDGTGSGATSAATTAALPSDRGSLLVGFARGTMTAVTPEVLSPVWTARASHNDGTRYLFRLERADTLYRTQRLSVTWTPSSNGWGVALVELRGAPLLTADAVIKATQSGSFSVSAVIGDGFPEVVDATETLVTTNVTTHTINYPPAVDAGDLLLLFGSVDNNTGYTVSSFGGFTAIGAGKVSNGVNISLVFAYRIADGSEDGGTTDVVLSAAERGAWRVRRVLAGTWHGTTPPEVATEGGSTNANPNPPSLTPSWGDAATLWFPAAATDGVVTHVAFPDTTTDTYTSSTTDGILQLATMLRDEATVDPDQFTVSGSEQWTSATVAVRPATGERLGSFTADAIVLSNYGNADFFVDAVIEREFSTGFSADAVVKRTIDGSLTANAIVFRTGTASFSLDAVIKRSAAASATADAVIKRSISASATADAVIKRNQTGSFSADAVIRRAQSGSFTADAVLRVARTGSFSADAVLKASVSGSATADAVIFRTISAVLSADAVLLRAATGSYSADAVLKAAVTGSFPANAAIKATATASFTADAVIKATQSASLQGNAVILRPQSDQFSADAVIERETADDFALDAVLLVSRSAALAGDAIILRNQPGALTADAVIFRTISGSFTADAVIMPTFTADAVLRRAQSGSFTADAVLMPTFTVDAITRVSQVGSFTANAWILGAGTGGFSVDAVIYREQTANFDANAVLNRNISDTFTADAIVEASNGASLTADAVQLKKQTASVSGDAVLLAGRMGGLTVDAVLLSQFAATATADAVLFKAQGASFTADATIALAGVTGFLADAVIRKEQSASVTADAVIERTSTADLTADAAIQVQRQASLTADSVLARALPQDFSANAIIRTTPTASFTVDAFINSSTAQTFTVDAVLASTIPGSLQAEAILKVIVERELDADAILRVAHGGSSTADAVIKRTSIHAFAVDAIKSRTNVQTYTFDAIKRDIGVAAFTADANIVGGAYTFTVDAWIGAVGADTFTADAWIVLTHPTSISASISATQLSAVVAAGSISGAIATSTISGAIDASTISAVIEVDYIEGAL